jgi:hypothetical protein
MDLVAAVAAVAAVATRTRGREDLPVGSRRLDIRSPDAVEVAEAAAAEAVVGKNENAAEAMMTEEATTTVDMTTNETLL